MNRIETLQQYLITNPDDSFLNHALALEYIKIGDDDNAYQLFQKILLFDENYIGSYYHLAKLLERKIKNFEATTVYKKGIKIAKSLKDNHSYNELAAALEDLEDD